MSKVDDYRRQLRELRNWRPFLLKESGLPGPRGNLELAHAFYLEASRDQIMELAALGPSDAPENTAKAFLAFCGIMGLGKLAAQGDTTKFAEMRRCASDPRWRIREAVATGLQYAADTQMGAVLRELRSWASGNWYEKRAAAAALCEPRLLTSASAVRATLTLIDRITRSMLRAPDRSDEAFRVLRQGMAYCWSVAIAAAPEQGKPLFEKWLTTTDSDIRWMLRQNLSKNRLVRMDPTWVKKCLKAIPE